MGKIILAGVLAAVAIGAVVLVIKLIAGAVGIISGFFNMILGIAVVLALVVIVVWMFRYAKKK